MKITLLIPALILATATMPARVSYCADDTGRAGYEYWIPSSETDSAGQHGIHFKQFSNGSAYRPKYPFSFQRWDEPQLGELSRRLDLDRLLAGADNDLEQAKRIALAVCNLWAHQAPIEYPSWNALAILDNVGQGQQYWCTYKQLVAMQCLAAVGLVSRIVPCHWHHSLEYWSNDWNKWVVIDAWTANFYRKEGVPLGSLELHRLSRATGGLEGLGVWEINVNPNRWEPERIGDSTLATTECYQHIRYIARNDFLSAPLAAKAPGAPGDYLKPDNQLNDPIQTGLLHVSWWQPGDAPSLVGPSVRYEQDYNFPLDQVEIDIRRPAFAEGVLDLEFATHTPEFDSFCLRVDGGEWEDYGSRFLWQLKPGVNRAEVRTRNKWGRYGAASVAELEYRPVELRVPVTDKIAVPDGGFEKAAPGAAIGDGRPGTAWKMIYTDDYQRPAFYGAVAESPHSGKRCFKIALGDPPIYAKLASAAFRVNPASDVTVSVWLRADRDGRTAVIYAGDNTPGGPGSQSIATRRVEVGTGWQRCEIKARISARTSHLTVGVQVLEGTLWIDDFGIAQDRRAEIPW